MSSLTSNCLSLKQKLYSDNEIVADIVKSTGSNSMYNIQLISRVILMELDVVTLY
jgi:hypothetical protein